MPPSHLAAALAACCGSASSTASRQPCVCDRQPCVCDRVRCARHTPAAPAAPLCRQAQRDYVFHARTPSTEAMLVVCPTLVEFEHESCRAQDMAGNYNYTSTWRHTDQLLGSCMQLVSGTVCEESPACAATCRMWQLRGGCGGCGGCERAATPPLHTSPTLRDGLQGEAASPVCFTAQKSRAC